MGEICNRLIQKFSDSQNTSARSVMVSQSYVGQRAAAPAASVTVVALPAAKPAREPASQPQDSREPFDMQPTPSSQHVHQSGSGNIYRGNKSQNVNHYGQGPGMVIASDNSVINQYFNGKRPDVMVQVFYDPHEIAALISALHPNISYVPLSIKYIFSELHKMEFIYYIDFATLPMVQAMDKLEQERQKSSNSLSYLMSHLFKIYPHDTAKLIDDILLNGFKNDDQVTHVLASIEMNALLNGMGYPNLGQFEAGTEQKRRAYFLFDHVKTYLALAVMLKNYLSCNEREFKTDNLWIMMEARYQIAFNLFNKYARLWENNYPPKNDTTLINMLSANTAEEEGQALEKREVYLTKLHLTLRRDLYLYNYETVVISGMYGSGKSTLAGQFAQESITHKAFDVVCWVNAETQEGIRSAYLKVIDWIDGVNERHHGTKRYVHTAETPLSDIQDTLGRYLSDPEARIKSLLFIYDNAPSYGAIQNTLLTQHVRNIITTRNQDVPDESSAYNLILDVFSPQEAERFIRKRITMPAAMPLATYDAHVKALAQKLEYHPLAIALACGYMNNKINRMRGITLEKYLQDFDRIWKESSAPQQLAVSLQISLDILTPAQREFFFQCCYLCPTDIASTIFVDHVHANDEQILDFMTLSDLSLTNFNDESRRDYFSIHRLTQHIGRMIFEASCSGADAAQTQQNLKRFFVGLHQRLSNRVHAIKDAFNLTNDPESLKKLYDDLTHMISHWEKLCAHALDHKIKLLDPEAKAIQLIRTKVSRKLLALEAEQEQSFDYVLRRQMPIPAEDMDVLHTIYNKLFAHIPKSQEALTLYPALFKLYQAGNMGFSIAEDHPHFFANQSAADCLSILLFLMGIKRLPHPLQGERLAMASDMIKEGTSPMMALASVYDADLNPMEAHTFIARLDGDHVPLSYHVMVQNLLLYKKLPPHAQQFVSTLHHIHEIGLTQLVQMTQVRKAGSFILNEYARYLTESLGAFRDFSEFNMAIENIPYFTLYLAQFPKTQAMRSADCARIKQILDTTPITQQRILALMTLAKNVDILDEAMPYINPSMNGYDVKDLFEAARKHQALDPESRQSIMDLAEQALSISTLRERGFLKPHHVLSVYQKIQHLRTNEQFDDIMTVVRAFMKDELDAGTLQSEEILVYLDAVPLAFESSVHYVSAIEQSFKWPPYLTPYDKGVLFGWIAHQYFRCLSSASEQNLANQPHQTYTEKEQRLNALAQQYADVSQNPWKTLKHIVHDVQAKQPSGFDLAGIFEGAVAHTQNIEPLMDKANALGIFADDVDNIPMGLYALDCLTEDRLDFLLENHVYLRLFDGVSINRFVLMAASMTHEQWLHLTNNLPNMDAYQSYFLTNRFQMSLPDFMKQLPKSTQLA